MLPSIKRDFGDQTPRAIVLDDTDRFRISLVRKLKRRGFQVVECKSWSQFFTIWIPGTIDVIVCDWKLSSNSAQSGDEVLAAVRNREWDVPFVLLSGQLGDTEKTPVLKHLLDRGRAAFVERGSVESSGNDEACDVAEKLVAGRDIALLKMVLALRPLALDGASVSTTSGKVTAADALASIVSASEASHNAGRPIANVRARRAAKRR